jgi:hypothetical protein
VVHAAISGKASKGNACIVGVVSETRARSPFACASGVQGPALVAVIDTWTRR